MKDLTSLNISYFKSIYPVTLLKTGNKYYCEMNHYKNYENTSEKLLNISIRSVRIIIKFFLIKTKLF